ncbi:response regulator, partial [Acinetobacter baumannii]
MDISASAEAELASVAKFFSGNNKSSCNQADRATVLVADDDPIFRDLVAVRLEKLGGCAVEACSGAQAWDFLLAQTFDLAIVNLGMPGL